MNHKSLAELYITGCDMERAAIKRILIDLDEEESLWFFEAVMDLVSNGYWMQ